MGKSMKKMLVLAKNQTAKGTDAAPTAALNAILCSSVTLQPMNAEFVARNLIRPIKGHSGKLVAGEHAGIEFDVELAGAGAAGTAPKYSTLLKGAFHSETITASTSVVYAPVDVETYTTLYCYLDGIKFSLVDALGTVGLTLNAKGIPVQRYKFLGVYAPATDAAFPTGVDYSGFKQPRVVGKSNTPTFTIAGVAAKASQFGFEQAAELFWRELIGGGGVESPDRAPTVKTTLELESIATRNWWEAARSGTEHTIQLVHGTTAGNIVQFDAIKAQINAAPDISNDQNNAMVGVGFDLLPNVGADEYTITIK